MAIGGGTGGLVSTAGAAGVYAKVCVVRGVNDDKTTKRYKKENARWRKSSPVVQVPTYVAAAATPALFHGCGVCCVVLHAYHGLLTYHRISLCLYFIPLSVFPL